MYSLIKSEINFNVSIKDFLKSFHFDSLSDYENQIIFHTLHQHDFIAISENHSIPSLLCALALIEKIYRSQNDLEGGYPDWNPQSFVFMILPNQDEALSLFNQINPLCKTLNLSTFILTDLEDLNKIHDDIKSHQIIIGIVPKIFEYYENHLLELSQVKAILLINPEEMINLDLKETIRFLLNRTSPTRQLITLLHRESYAINDLFFEFQADPIYIQNYVAETLENISHQLILSNQFDKPYILLKILSSLKTKRSIVFLDPSENKDKIAAFLRQNNHQVVTFFYPFVADEFKLAENEDKPIIYLAIDYLIQPNQFFTVDLIINYSFPKDFNIYAYQRRYLKSENLGIISFYNERDHEIILTIEKIFHIKFKYFNQEILKNEKSKIIYFDQTLVREDKSYFQLNRHIPNKDFKNKHRRKRKNSKHKTMNYSKKNNSYLALNPTQKLNFTQKVFMKIRNYWKKLTHSS